MARALSNFNSLNRQVIEKESIKLSVAKKEKRGENNLKRKLDVN